jgi:hypothetical protein
MHALSFRGNLASVVAALVLLPMAGGAKGGTTHTAATSCERPGSTAGVLSAFGESSKKPCFQDQYGNRYVFTVDAEHHYLYGAAVNESSAQCARKWYLLGSYSDDGRYELTATNPLGDGDPPCVPAYKIKGIWPDGAWYYSTGFGNQEFTWATCGSGPTAPSDKGGLLG